MSKRRKSVNLHLLEGNKNRLTKEEIQKRQEHEESMKGYTDKIQAPSYLTPKQQEEFDELATELVRLEIFNNLDVDNLARYIDSRDQYIKIVRLLRKTKFDEFDDYAKIQRTKNSLFTECRQLATDLGLTITSRLKLVIPKTDDETPKTEAERRFSGRL